MNDKRRKELAAIYKRMEAVRDVVTQLKADADEIRGDLQEVREAEDEAFNNLPEGLQAAEKGQAMEQAVAYMDTALEWLETLADLEDADDALEAVDNAEHAN
jgi:hypothetical protein